MVEPMSFITRALLTTVCPCCLETKETDELVCPCCHEIHGAEANRAGEGCKRDVIRCYIEIGIRMREGKATVFDAPRMWADQIMTQNRILAQKKPREITGDKSLDRALFETDPNVLAYVEKGAEGRHDTAWRAGLLDRMWEDDRGGWRTASTARAEAIENVRRST